MSNHRGSAPILVVGAGIVGLATAYKLLLSRPGTELIVLEKETGVGRHQSSHNSGVLHAGVSYAPGSLKARLAVDGIRQMIAFCRAQDIRHEICGKVIIASDQGDVPRLRQLMARGEANGLLGLRWLDAAELGAVEPHASGVAGLHVPEEGIADYPAVCAALARLIGELGGRILTGSELLALRRSSVGWIAHTPRAELEVRFLINCAGLQSDRVARLAGERPDIRIVPFRGDYFALRPERCHLVRHLIYPLPDPEFPFLGVHFTRRLDGRIEAGPNAVLALHREGYAGDRVRAGDALDALTFPGFWRFAARHRRMCWEEIRRSHSRVAFARALRRLVPALEPGDLVPAGSGIRAQAMRRNGDFVDDFALLERPTAVHVLNAPSPGATASLAIADVIAGRVTAEAA